MKAYILSKSTNTSDGGITVGVYLDKTKCDTDLKRLNFPRLDEELIHKECENCNCNDYRNDQHGKLKSRNTCQRADIKTDRNGEYCENDLSDWYSMKTDWYFVEETEILE